MIESFKKNQKGIYLICISSIFACIGQLLFSSSYLTEVSFGCLVGIMLSVCLKRKRLIKWKNSGQCCWKKKRGWKGSWMRRRGGFAMCRRGSCAYPAPGGIRPSFIIACRGAGRGKPIFRKARRNWSAGSSRSPMTRRSQSWPGKGLRRSGK